MTRYPSHSIYSFNFGNGIVHTTTQNVHRLPDLSLDQGAEALLRETSPGIPTATSARFLISGRRHDLITPCGTTASITLRGDLIDGIGFIEDEVEQAGISQGQANQTIVMTLFLCWHPSQTKGNRSAKLAATRWQLAVQPCVLIKRGSLRSRGDQSR